MYICLKRLAGKLWKKNCPNFLHTMYKVGRKLESVSHPFLAVLSSSVMQQISSFFKQVCFFLKKNAYMFLFFFNRVPYMQISGLIPGANIIGRKVNVASINREWGSGSVLRPQQGFYGADHPKKMFRL